MEDLSRETEAAKGFMREYPRVEASPYTVARDSVSGAKGRRRKMVRQDTRPEGFEWGLWIANDRLADCEWKRNFWV